MQAPASRVLKESADAYRATTLRLRRATASRHVAVGPRLRCVLPHAVRSIGGVQLGKEAIKLLSSACSTVIVATADVTGKTSGVIGSAATDSAPSVERTALLIVDVQPFFADQDLQPPVGEVLPRLRRLLDAAKAAGIMRVFIRAEFPPDRWTRVWQEQFDVEIFEPLWPGSPAARFVAGFQPESGDLVIVKDCYSSFLRTDLEQQLRDAGIDTVIIAGLTTDVCISSTARDAFQLDFRTIVVADCCAERTLSRHENALETLTQNFGRVVTSDELIQPWERARR